MAAVMPVISLASAVIGTIGRFSSARRQDAAAERQETAAREAASMRAQNAALIEQEGREEARRMRDKQEREQAEARARAAASGVTMAGTPGVYLGEMQRVGEEEVDWLQYSTRQRAAQEQTAGRYDYLTGTAQAEQTRAGATSTRSQGWTGLISGVGEFGSAYNWWQD